MQVQSTSQTFTPVSYGTTARSPDVQSGSDVKAEQRVNPQGATDTHENVDGATKKLQDFVDRIHGNIQFSVDQDTGETVVKVIDKSTQDVLMQLPSKEALEIAKALDKFQGLLVKQQA